jgi:WD40 repeat protein
LEGVPASGLAGGPDGKSPVFMTGGFYPLISGPLAFAPDGQVLTTGACDGSVRLHDATTGKELSAESKSGWSRGIMTVCGFDPSGRWLAARDYGGLHLCETASGREIHRLTLGSDASLSQGFTSAVTFAPDGGMVVAADEKGIYQWDTATGKEVRRVPCQIDPQHLRPSAALVFAPDGRTVACANHEAIIRLWDTATLKELRQFRDDESGVCQLFYFPDGKRLASQSLARTVRTWDVVTGRELSRWALPSGENQAFSPDGKLAVVDVGKAEAPAVALCDLATGKELRRLPGIKSNYCGFSADGKLLAIDGDPMRYPDRARTIQLLELASGRVRARFAGQFGFPAPMMFSPDGELLATGSSDATALIWDVTGRLGAERLRAEQLSADRAEGFWADLAADNAEAAHQAIWTLAAAPGLAIPLLREKLRPIPAGEQPQVEQLREDLASARVAVREHSTAALEEVGDSPEAALQNLRAVEVLEHTATSEARELLDTLSRGAAEARLTQEAKAALERMIRKVSR